MYKTVRKGDASLQYTILPQSDQFYGNVPPPSPPPERNHLFVKRTIIIIAVLIFISCYAMAYLVNRTRAEVLNAVAMGQIDHQLLPKVNETHLDTEVHASDNENDEIDLDVSSTMSNDDLEDTFGMDGGNEASSVPNSLDASSTFVPSSTENKLTSANTKPDIIVSSLPSDINPPLNVDSTSTASLTTLEASLSTSDYEKTSADDTTTMKSSTGSFKKAKMPRVTLKLRENETIPQMYMKAGIASYKKGNITTSVLAHGLSLEGLIFKTPEGTIKPWSEKWPFSDSSPYVQWKRTNEMREQIFAVLVTLMAVSVMIFCVLSVAQLKASRRRWQNVEEPPLMGREEEENEGRSKLLESEGKENEEKE